MTNYNIYKKAIKDVSRTDKFGALRVLISIKKHLNDFYQFSAYSMPKSEDEIKDEHKNEDSAKNGANIPRKPAGKSRTRNKNNVNNYNNNSKAYNNKT